MSSSPSSSEDQVCHDLEPKHDHNEVSRPSTPTHSFTDEQERRFQIRFEEGFDVFTDDDYVKWLEIHHPEALQLSAPKDFTLAEHFASVSPATEVGSLVPTNTIPASPNIIKLQPWCNEPSQLSIHEPSNN